MTKNPLINALSATLYIGIVATVMFYAPKQIDPVQTVFVPIAILSLFSLSAAIMGYLFVFQPIQMYLDGKKKQAVDLFLKTLVIFAGTTLVIFILLFSGIIH